MNMTGILVKPEAWHRRHEVLKDLQSLGFRLLGSFDKKLAVSDLQSIYFQSPPEFMRLANQAYLDKLCLAAVFECADAATEIVKVVGHHYDPDRCADGALRKKYAAPAWSFAGEIFYANAIHRPQGELDTEKFLIWFIENLKGPNKG